MRETDRQTVTDREVEREREREQKQIPSADFSYVCVYPNQACCLLRFGCRIFILAEFVCMSRVLRTAVLW